MQEVFEKIIDKLLGLNRLNNITNKLQPPKSTYDYQTGVIDSIETVKQFAAEYNNGWIPCGKRLPVGKEWEITDEDGDTLHKHVLCYTDNRDVPVSVAFYQEGVWFTADTYDTINVIAWQPLPQPYELKEGEA